MRYVIPVLFILVLTCAAFKRVNVFSSFSRGAGEAVKFVFNLIPLRSEEHTSELQSPA